MSETQLMEQVKKSIDRLALIELCKAGASNIQIREIFGKIDNNTMTKIRKAVHGKKHQAEE